jgi:hypothetical protein
MNLVLLPIPVVHKLPQSLRLLTLQGQNINLVFEFQLLLSGEVLDAELVLVKKFKLVFLR